MDKNLLSVCALVKEHLHCLKILLKNMALNTSSYAHTLQGIMEKSNVLTEKIMNISMLHIRFIHLLILQNN